jgi:hypothetical protein
MPQLTKGAQPILDELYGVIEAIQESAERGAQLATYNPPFAAKKHREILDLTIRLTLLVQKVRPFMERAAPTIEQQLAEIKERLEAIEQQQP